MKSLEPISSFCLYPALNPSLTVTPPLPIPIVYPLPQTMPFPGPTEKAPRLAEEIATPRFNFYSQNPKL
jgi:hypothetical protein